MLFFLLNNNRITLNLRIFLTCNLLCIYENWSWPYFGWSVETCIAQIDLWILKTINAKKEKIKTCSSEYKYYYLLARKQYQILITIIKFYAQSYLLQSNIHTKKKKKKKKTSRKRIPRPHFRFVDKFVYLLILNLVAA